MNLTYLACLELEYETYQSLIHTCEYVYTNAESGWDGSELEGLLIRGPKVIQELSGTQDIRNPGGIQAKDKTKTQVRESI